MSILWKASKWLIFGANRVSQEQSALVVLTYHRVLEKKDPLVPDWPCAKEFAAELAMLSSVSKLQSLDCALDSVINKGEPGLHSAITFDDGYRDNLEVAVPVLRNAKATATVFVSSGYSDGQVMFNDVVRESIRYSKKSFVELAPLLDLRLPIETIEQKRSAIRVINQKLKYLSPVKRDQIALDFNRALGSPPVSGLMLNELQLAGLCRSGIEVGCHTHQHVIATTLSSQQFYENVRTSKKILQSIAQRDVRFFAFPNGKSTKDFSVEHAGVVKDLGFKAMFSTDQQALLAHHTNIVLPRFSPWAHSRIGRFVQIARSVKSALKNES